MLAGLLAGLLAQAAQASTPSLMTYQGRLKESGAPVTGTRKVNIYLCDALAGPTCTATGEQDVAVVNSLFRTTFTVPAAINLENGTWYMEVRLGLGGATILTPREQLTAAPYAMVAASATSVAASAVRDGTLGAGVIFSGNAGTASALAANPSDCAANQFANAIAASGDLTCAGLSDADVPDTITINGASITAGSVGSGKLTDGAVTMVKIQDGAVTSAKLALSGVATANIEDGAVTTAKIGDASVSSTKLTLNAVGAGHLQDGAVFGAKILDGGVATGKLADVSVATLKLQDGAVTSAKLAANGVATANIQDGAVTSAKLTANGVA
ncbi:MAG: hypothetical protein HY928_15255, partial [Elusimicrobia bacterium]|nr:hypothetical protein [Elusimicrobiota bacterium]